MLMRDCQREWLALYRGRALLMEMARRELAARYAGSAAGIAWAFLQPTLMVAAYYLVFDVVFQMRLGQGAPTQSVGTYLIVGALPWLAFCEGLSRGSASLVEAGSMLQKNAVAPVFFVARSVLSGLAVFIPLMTLLALAYIPKTGMHSAYLALPLLLLVQGVLVLVLAHVLALLTAAIRDVQQVLAFLLSVGIYCSPVLFPVTMFPQDWRWVLYLNPMSAITLGYQAVMLHGVWPDISAWWITGIWIAGGIWLLDGLVRRSRDQLMDWL